MQIGLIESIIYGFVSGITEFLPISSDAHQRILMQVFGIENRDPLMDLLVHAALLAAIFFSCRVLIGHLRREQAISMRRSRSMRNSTTSIMDIRLIRQATLPMIIGIVLLSYITGSNQSLPATVVLLLINGIILFLSERMAQGNKSSISMSAFDSVLIGIFGSLSAFSGISRIGCTFTTSIMRGAKRQHALNWSVLLGIPALGTLCALNAITLFSQLSTVQLWGNFFSYLFSVLAAFCGGCVGIRMLRFFVTRVSLFGYAFYSWGAAIFSFLIYLTVV